MKLFDCVKEVTSTYEIGKKYTRKQIIKDVIRAFPMYKPGCVIPSDYCYNISNDGIDFEKWLHLFKHRSRGRYIYLGENCKFTGEVMHHPKGGVEYPCGEWKDGVYYKRNRT